MENSIDSALQKLGEALKSGSENELFAPVTFNKDVYGMGILWKGQGSTKQLVLTKNSERIFCSEDFDLAKDKAYAINNIKVLGESELGPSVVKSNLRQVGRLRGLLVDGSLSVNEYLHFDGNTDRLGLGIAEPNAALSVAEDGVEVMMGTRDYTAGEVGTYASNDFHIVTDNTPRISVTAGGDIQLGNENKAPVNVSVNGTVSIGVNNPDPTVDLHVRGAVKFNNSIQIKGKQPPEGGTFNQGDICWNSKPSQGQDIGWVCVRAGTPGLWCPFGTIR
jgi:hypothetical protein